MMRLHQYNVFPNMTLLANADHLTVMTSHPGPDPDHGELVMILWTRMPPGAPRIKPADVRMKADEAHPGLVLTQDITVLAGLQRGLHQPGLTHLTLSNEERRVINTHRNLERYLDLPESDRITGGETPDSPAAQRDVANPKGERAQEAIDAEVILDTAARLIELDGVDAFTMRGLAEQLGVAVTSIYWHVGGRDKLFDSLVDRLLSEMAHLPVRGRHSRRSHCVTCPLPAHGTDRTTTPSRHRTRARSNAVVVPSDSADRWRRSWPNWVSPEPTRH